MNVAEIFADRDDVEVLSCSGEELIVGDDFTWFEY